MRFYKIAFNKSSSAKNHFISHTNTLNIILYIGMTDETIFFAEEDFFKAILLFFFNRILIFLNDFLCKKMKEK